MSIAEIATNIPVVYVGASLIYYAVVAWEKCKAAMVWLTESDDETLEYEPAPIRQSKIEFPEYPEYPAPNKNEVYV